MEDILLKIALYICYYFLVIISGINGLQRIETIFKHLINTSRLPSRKFFPSSNNIRKFRHEKEKNGTRPQISQNIDTNFL